MLASSSSASSSAMRLLSSRAASKQAVRGLLPAQRDLTHSGAQCCAACQSVRAYSSSTDSRAYAAMLPSGTVLSLSAGPVAASLLRWSASLSRWLQPASASSSFPPLALQGLSAPAAAAEPAEQQSSIWNWDGLLNAVPKKKVSHSRKAMRAANKGLKDRVDLVHCQGCGRPKLAHHLCAHCFQEINRWQKTEHPPFQRRP